jgi:ABC-type maltose transport system permease subunit
MTSNAHFNRRSLLKGAAAVIQAPVAVIFVLTQRYFIDGIHLHGLRG